MKPVSFVLAKTEGRSFLDQQEDLVHFYDAYHTHPEWQLCHIQAGTGTAVLGDYVGPFSAGDLFLVGSGLPHVFRNSPEYYLPGSSLRARGRFLYIDLEAWGSAFWNTEAFQDLNRFLDQHRGAYEVRGVLKQRLLERWRRLEAPGGMAEVLCFLELLLLMQQDTSGLRELSGSRLSQEWKAAGCDRLGEVIRYCSRECHRRIPLREIAAVAHMTPEAFSRFFHKSTRKTFTEFLNQLRVSQACRLLQQGKSPVEAADGSGFQNLSHFYRTFRKFMHLSPAEYLRKL